MLANSAKPASAIAMNGTTLLMISDPGCFGVQAKRPMISPRLSVSSKKSSPGAAGLSSTRWSFRSRRREAISASTSSSMNFTLRTTGASRLAVSSPRAATAAAATIAGRPRNDCRRTARWLSEPGIPSVPGSDVDPTSPSPVRAAAHEIKHGREVGLDRIEPVGIDAALPSERIDELVRPIGDEDEVLVEIGLQTQPDARLHPLRVELPRIFLIAASEVATDSTSRSTRSA